MKNIFLLFFLLCSVSLLAQFPNNPVKVRLGYQTTAKGLIYYGTGAPSSSPTGFRNDAFAYVDTTSNTMYLYDESNDLWEFVTDSTYVAGVLPVVDSTRLLQDSILVYYQDGVEIGRDTLSLATPETDPIYAADSSSLKADIAANASINLQTTLNNSTLVEAKNDTDAGNKGIQIGEFYLVAEENTMGIKPGSLTIKKY
jgi:hypothetical protein